MGILDKRCQVEKSRVHSGTWEVPWQFLCQMWETLPSPPSSTPMMVQASWLPRPKQPICGLRLRNKYESMGPRATGRTDETPRQPKEAKKGQEEIGNVNFIDTLGID